MNAPLAQVTGAPRTLAIRRPLVRPTTDPRRLMRAMRGRLTRRVTALGAILLLLCLVQVWLRLQVVDIGYQLSAARKMEERLDHERRQLRAELATLQDTAALADAARARIGLAEPQKGQVVDLR
jgi:cell division protein FtsB